MNSRAIFGAAWLLLLPLSCATPRVNEPPAAVSPGVVQAPAATQPPPASTANERPKSSREVARERVAHGDAAAFDEVVRVQRSAEPAEAPAVADERPFDADQLAQLIPVEHWLPLAGDPSPALRQLVAAVLSAGVDLPQILQRIQSHPAQGQADQLTRACFVEALLQRRLPGATPLLLPLIAEEPDPALRHQLARALARSGFDTAVQARLFEMLDGPTMNDAALATLLGGTPEAAARTIALYAQKPPATLAELLALWKESFNFWSVDDLESGILFRYMENAEAVSHVVVRGAPQTWAKRALTLAFDNIVFDDGPHSLTRIQLQTRLLGLVRGADEQKRRSALLAFVFMRAQGALLALRDDPPPVGPLARDAYFEMLHPATSN